MFISFLSFLSFGILFVAVNTQTFTFDLSEPTIPFPHYWEECVGSGHALLGLRADWQAHLSQAHKDLGFKQVRFHGVFDDDMSALLIVDNKVVYSWFNIDSLYDFILSIGMRPFVELSFMPEYLATGTETEFHYNGYIGLPNNVSLWQDFVSHFAEHIIDRYGWDEVSQWNFEFWNEPNCGFINGTQADYFNFYQQTITALKKVNSGIRVGGPATCESAWLSDFINFCQQNNVPFDFISSHEYPTDIQPTNRDILIEVFKKSREIVGENKLLYYTEFNDGLYRPNAYHDTPYAASFLFHVVHGAQGLVDTLSWWTFTDIFEERGQNSQPFLGGYGYGLLNMYKVPKPSYLALRFLHNLGTREVPVKTTSNGTVGAYGILSPNALELSIIVYNYDLPDSNIQNETVTIELTNLQIVENSALIYRIDEDHGYAAGEWLKQGSPLYPTPSQIQDQMNAAYNLGPEILYANKTGKSFSSFSINLPKWGSALISVTVHNGPGK